MLPTLPVNQAFILWARCTTLDKADLATEALKLTTKGDIMQFATQEIDLLDSRAVDKLVSNKKGVKSSATQTRKQRCIMN